MTQANPIPHSQLGDHFTPIFVVLLPFYYAYPHPETLLVLQAIVLVAGAWPMYLLARLKVPSYALVWVAVYFLFLPLAYINLYDFHEIALAVVPLGFTFYFLERGRTVWFLAFLLVTFLVKEEMALIGAGFGLYRLLGRREWKLGLGVLAGSVAAFELILQVAIPYFAGGRSFPYIATRYAEVGGSPLGILRTLVTDPLQVVRVVLQLKKVEFVIALFGPVLGLSAFGGWAAVVLVPTLAYTLLTNYEPQFSFSHQYSAPLIPLIVGTAIIGMSRLPKRTQPYIAASVLISSLAFSWAYGYLPYSRKFDPGLFETPARYASFLPALAQIPADAHVSAENGFPSHLSERRYIYEFGYEGVQDAQWVVLDYKGAEYNLATFNDQVTYVKSLGYEEVASGYGLALLRKS